MPKRYYSPLSDFKLQTAAILGDELTRSAVSLQDFCERHGVSDPTARRAVRILRDRGFTVCSESQRYGAPGGKWMFSSLYTMPEKSARRFRKLRFQSLDELAKRLGPKVLALALEGAE